METKEAERLTELIREGYKMPADWNEAQVWEHFQALVRASMNYGVRLKRGSTKEESVNSA